MKPQARQSHFPPEPLTIPLPQTSQGRAGGPDPDGRGASIGGHPSALTET